MKRMKLMALLLTAALTLETMAPGFTAPVVAAELDTEVVELVEDAIVSEDLVVEESAAEEIVVDETVVEEPAAEETTEENVVEETAEESTEETVVEETTVEETEVQPATEETVVEEIAESVVEEVVAEILDTTDVSDGDVAEEVELADDRMQVDDAMTEEIFKQAVKERPVADEERIPCDSAVEVGEAEAVEDGAGIMAAAKNPSSSFRQRYAYNYFYADADYATAYLEVTIKDPKVSSVSLVSNTYFVLYNTPTIYAKGKTASWTSFWVDPKSNAMAEAFAALPETQKKEATKLKLRIATSDGRSWEQPFTVKYQMKKPSLTLGPNASTVYMFQQGTQTKLAANRLSAELYYKGGKYSYGRGLSAAKLLTKQDKKGKNVFSVSSGASASDVCSFSGTYCSFYFIGDASATAKVSLKCTGWAMYSDYTYKVTLNKKDIAPKLSSSKATVNAFYGDAATLNLSIPKASYSSISLISPAECLSKTNPGLTISASGHSITVRCPKNAPKGSYKYKVNVRCTFNDNVTYDLKPITFTVNVTNQQVTAKNVSIKKSGSSVSMSNSKKRYVHLYPQLKNVNATFSSVSFSKNDTSGAASKLNLSSYGAISAKEGQKPQKVKALLTYTFIISGSGETISFDVLTPISITK